MTIKIDLYDVFAYTVPGTFYLFTIVYISNLTGIVSLDLNQINAASGWLVFIGAIVAYAIGYIFDPVAIALERAFSGTKDKSRDRLNIFKKKYSHIKFNIEPRDMAVLRGYVSKQSQELGDRIQKNGATRTMLRNLSLNFLLLAFAFVLPIANRFDLKYLFLGIISLWASIVCMRECFKFADWFYDLTLQSLLALSSESKRFIVLDEDKKLENNELLSELLKENSVSKEKS